MPAMITLANVLSSTGMSTYASLRVASCLQPLEPDIPWVDVCPHVSEAWNLGEVSAQENMPKDQCLQLLIIPSERLRPALEAVCGESWECAMFAGIVDNRSSHAL